MACRNLEWNELSQRELLQTPVLTVNEITSAAPNGENGTYIVMDAPDWVIVIPEIDGKFLMVRQW